VKLSWTIPEKYEPPMCSSIIIVTYQVWNGLASPFQKWQKVEEHGEGLFT